MIVINKRKFLTELGKLLTFMFEEDRQRALAVYEEMLDEAEDETALLQFLGSPTKQAVTVARAYNAKERRLAVTSQAGEENADVVNDEEPGFVVVINGIRDAAIDAGIIPETAAGQYSLYEEYEEADVTSEESGSGSEQPEEEDLEEFSQPEEQEPAPAETEVQKEESPAQKAEPEEQEPELADEDHTFETLPVFSLDAPEEEPEEPEAPEPAEEAVQEASAGEDAELPASEQETAEENAPASEAADAEEVPEEYDNFQMDLGPIPEETRIQPDEIDEMMATFRGDKAIPTPPPRKTSDQTTLAEFELAPVEKTTPWRQASEEDELPSGRMSIPRTILYLLVAVPITTAGVLILLVPTLLFLLAAVVAGVAAFRIATLAFNSFAVFADIVVVLGAALVLLAVAIFLFWIFVSFIGGAIAGLINQAIRIGGKVCYREDKKA